MATRKEIKHKKNNKNTIIASVVIVVIIAAFILSQINFQPAKEENNIARYGFTKEGVITLFKTSGEKIFTLDGEFATNDYERMRGLMFRTEMKENQAMLFLFPAEEMQSFWMRNTFISLDIIFINEKKEIVTIHKNTTPQSDQGLPSSAPSRYVLETVAGFSERHNLQIGDKIDWLIEKEVE